MTIVAILLALIFLLEPSPSSAQLRTELVASGLSRPVAFIHDPLFSNVSYIVEQGGVVKVLVDGQLQSTPFIDLRDEISTGGERGLLGMAFSPDAGSGRVFVNFTNAAGHTVIARFRRASTAPFRADVATRFDLLWPSGERFIRQPFANHNGGHLEFGPDGRLFIGLGDGGSGNDPQNHAQNPLSLLGKMLRIDVGVSDGDPVGYRVPPDNPFVDGNPIAALGEIWSFGLRNPWRYSFDSVGAGASGALFVADVGQGAREEINAEPFAAGGRNYGWRIREGRLATPGVPATAPAFEPLMDPIHEYGRDTGQAITGGYVYRGTGLGAAYHGRYFFADYATSRVWSLGLSGVGSAQITAADLVEHTAELGGGLGGITSFGRDASGELYLVTFSGQVRRIAGPVGPIPSAPRNLTASVNGQTVSVTWSPPPDGAVATAYRLEAGSVTGAADLATISTAATPTGLTFANVPVGTYYIRVRSVNNAGASPPSNEFVVIVGSATGCSGPPSAPASLSSLIDGRTVTLLWSAPAGNAASQFAIEAGSAAGLANLAVIAVAGGTTTLTVQAPPGLYFVRVRSGNACGVSGASGEIVVSIP